MLNKICIFFLLISSSSFAKESIAKISTSSNCNYYMADDSLIFAGYTINYSTAVTKLMDKKGYVRVFDYSNKYDVVVEAKALQQGSFDYAIGTIHLFQNKKKIFTQSKSKRCYTQNCGTSDIAKSLNKLFIRLKMDFPRCK